MSIEILNEGNFESEVSNGLVLVDFYADWCGPCKMIAPVLDEIDLDFGNEIKIVKFDIEQSESIPEKYGVMSIPTLLLFKDGKIVNECVGFQPKDAILNFIGL